MTGVGIFVISIEKVACIPKEIYSFGYRLWGKNLSPIILINIIKHTLDVRWLLINFFESFTWGSLCYQILINSSHKFAWAQIFHSELAFILTKLKMII